MTDFAGAKHTCTAKLEDHNLRRRVGRLDQWEEPAEQRRKTVASAVHLRREPEASPDADAGRAAAGPSGSDSADGLSPLAHALQAGLFDLGDGLAAEAPCNDGLHDPVGAALAAFDSTLSAAGQAGAVDASMAYRFFSAGVAAGFAAVSYDVSSRSVHVKLVQRTRAGDELPHAAHVEQLSAAQLPLALAHVAADMPLSSAAAAPAFDALSATVRPGCTLVTLNVLLRATRGAAPPHAAELLRRTLATPGAAGELLRSQSEVLAADSLGGEATFRRAAGASAAQSRVPLAPRASPLSPLAALCTRGAEFALESAGAPGTVHHCRLSSGARGRVLPVAAVPQARAGGAPRLAVQRCDEEGVALFEAVPPGWPLHRAGAPRPVLLTSDAAIAAEVAASGAALGSGVAAEAARTKVELLLSVLGAALQPAAAPRVVCAAAAAAVWLGWGATLLRLLKAPALADDTAAAHQRLVTLLCHASAAARPDMLRVMLTAPLVACGGELAAALVAAERSAGLVSMQFAVAAAQSALLAREGEAAEATPQAIAAAAALLRAAALGMEAATPTVVDGGGGGGAPGPPRWLAWRVPGAFADDAMEREWLRRVAHTMHLSDLFGYPFASLLHGAQLVALYRRAGLLPSGMQALYFAVMFAAMPAVKLALPAFATRNREALHICMRLVFSLYYLVNNSWARTNDELLGLVSPAQAFLILLCMSVFSLAAAVRAPLHAAVQAISFVVMGALGVIAHLRLRLAVAALNLVIVWARERSSRRRFLADWRGQTKKVE